MAVKKVQAENKAVAAPVEVSAGLVAVTVGAGPIHHGGRRYGPGDSMEVSEQVAAALIGAGLVAKGGDG